MTHTKTVLAVVLGACVLSTGAFAAPPGSNSKIQVDGQRPVFPESITSTPNGAIFTSSVGTGQIYRAPHGTKEASAWSKKMPHGPQSILGVYAVPDTGTLWACYSDWSFVTGNKGKAAILRAFDLKSGAVKHSYKLPPKSFCNDITKMSNGTIYVTDTYGGRIMRLKKGATKLESWFHDPRLKGVDGITFGANGSLILNNVVTDKLFRLTVRPNGQAGKLTKLALSTPVKGPDGMRRGADGRIYLAENGSGKVDQVSISGDNADIHTVASGYQAPTSMTADGNMLYIVESKIHQYGNGKNPSPFYVYPVQVAGH